MGIISSASGSSCWRDLDYYNSTNEGAIMDRRKTKKDLKKIFNYIEKGSQATEYGTFDGHPGLFFFHSKEEFSSELNKLIKEKKIFDKYDIYYITQYLIKFLLGEYDSHTKIDFLRNKAFPITFKVENKKVCITNISKMNKDILGCELVSINGYSIDEILSKLEKIICYSTHEFLNEKLALNLRQIKILKSISIIEKNSEEVTYQINCQGRIKSLTFNVNNKQNDLKDNIPNNYTYEIVDNIMVLHYNSCSNEERMNKFVEIIKQEAQKNNIKNFIVDIRNNGGGNSNIIAPLIDFLKGKRIVTLINERVFSSGRMALVNLKNIGSYTIGTDISTALNCFGNIPGKLILKDLELVVARSVTYWYYDKDLKCRGFYKKDFAKYFKDKKELLKPTIIHPDQYVYITVDDIINNRDPQLESAIEYFKHHNN